jgi:hypothetical protein
MRRSREGTWLRMCERNRKFTVSQLCLFWLFFTWGTFVDLFAPP